MTKLSAEQYQELEELLGHDPNQDGDWSIVNDNHGPCIYAVNSKGTIVVRLTCIDRAGRKQKPRKCFIREFPDHYLFCNLNNKDIRLHRIMAATWLDDWDESLTVNHKDGNKQNNSIENLEMMTVHDNCLYYHDAECIREQRQQDYAHHGNTIRGRIHITNGVDSKMIHPEDGIPEGWWKGRPKSMKDKLSSSLKGSVAHNTGKYMITDGNVNKYVDEGEVIPQGWRRGSCLRVSEEQAQLMSSIMSNRIFIHKGEENKRVYRIDLPDYLSDGWVEGRSPGLIAKHSAQMSIKMKGENNPFYGKHHSPEVLKKISESNKGKSSKHTEETKEKLRQLRLGSRHTEESKKKMSDAMKGRPSNNKGFIWITDGVLNKQIPEKDLHLYPGFTKGITREKIERVYVNDGSTNHKIPADELDAWLGRGYVRGLLKKTNK